MEEMTDELDKHFDVIIKTRTPDSNSPMRRDDMKRLKKEDVVTIGYKVFGYGDSLCSQEEF